MVLMITYDASGVEYLRQTLTLEEMAKIIFSHEPAVWRGAWGDAVYYSTVEAKSFTVHEIR